MVEDIAITNQDLFNITEYILKKHIAYIYFGPAVQHVGS